MSDAEQAFEDALDGAEEALGKREFIIIRGKQIDALYCAWGDDLLVSAGGEASGADYRVAIRLTDCPPRLELLEPVRGRNKTLGFSAVENKAATAEITLVDPAAEVTE